MSTIQTRAMLITLTISCWTGMRKDDNVAKEVDIKHGAQHAGRYAKYIVPKESLDGCNTAARLMREHHNKLSLPWTDGGTRLLPTKLYREYDDKLQDLRDAYYREVDKFLQLYDTVLRGQAQSKLGSLYNAADYPPASQLKHKFGVQLDILPVPSGSDFRVDINTEQVQRIQKEIAARMDERARAATSAAWARILDVVGNVHERVSGTRPVVRDSLGDHVRELARLLPGLNISDDPTLDRVATAISADLILDLALLRKSPKERARVAKIAADILEMVPHEHRAVQPTA